jgi:hypothetical protein
MLAVLEQMRDVNGIDQLDPILASTSSIYRREQAVNEVFNGVIHSMEPEHKIYPLPCPGYWPAFAPQPGRLSKQHSSCTGISFAA